ncbi:XVIPCD domain-containing protein [Luteibacter aegosomatissinici]|uniref:XVIPCD domain-containing protein n=1 Tax=Luteibacter aegosomatissinici TaxID=2911539 RepID=UPI001FFBE9BC|nr:XVIPCD domain-containing protein [Luteibacter aegosomatissinici]UPG93609.1 hypothetical protein L2Y97_17440 [Luteibacter aegosomatissinici]
MKRNKRTAVAAVGMWFVLAGCATPDDRGKTRQELVAQATEDAEEMAGWPDISVEDLAEEHGIVYIRTPSPDKCPSDPFVHGPQDRCHPHHAMYADIRVLIEKFRSSSSHALADDEAERIAMAAFFCARLNKLEKVDEIESWPKGAPWASRLLTLHQHPGKGPGGRPAGAVDIPAISGLAAKHNQLILTIRYTDRGMTYDSGNP